MQQTSLLLVHHALRAVLQALTQPLTLRARRKQHSDMATRSHASTVVAAAGHDKDIALERTTRFRSARHISCPIKPALCLCRRAHPATEYIMHCAHLPQSVRRAASCEFCGNRGNTCGGVRGRHHA